MTATRNVLVLGDLAPEGVSRLRDAGLTVEVRPEPGAIDPSALRGREALVVAPGAPVTASMLAEGSALLVIGCAGVDTGAIDVVEATRRGILVVHAPDSALLSEAEHALALVLAVARDLAGADAALRRGDAGPRPGDGIEVRGKTLGLLGARPSSSLLAERARALGMNVLACEPGAPAGSAAAALECIPPEQVLTQADVLVVQTPSEAPALFGAGELAQLRAGARLVSPCTPGAVELGALAAALADGRVAGAAVAVDPAEPLAAAVLEAPRLLLTSPAESSTADARVRAAVSAADQVVAALDGRLLRGAVNVPAASGEDVDELMPYMDLCARLGRLLVQLAGEPVDAVEITYGGSIAYYDTRLLTLGVLGGLLAGRAAGPVNFVNAELVAEELGVSTLEVREPAVPDFPRLISVAVAGTDGRMSVSGTSLGSQHKQRLVRVFGEDVDIEPAAHMAFLRYVDAPGIGGRVGTLLGEWGVNIGHMSVGRGKLGDEAVMALTLDESLTPAQTEQLVAGCGLAYARTAEL
ncbi:MAG TPA: NAD(P)-dependent oxidoreductase [Thermoleophilia bacterium]|nr:NAD(P)-dependent oxidoreductase [Thermoleophilia bacterium]